MTGLRILVNGATGALGRATMTAAVGAGHRPVAGTRRTTLADAIRVPDDGRVDPALLAGVDAIINCAGRVDGTPAELHATNVAHVNALATAAQVAGVRRFVQVSSFSVYGRVEAIDADTPVVPAIAYGRSKADAERVLEAVGGVSTLSLRLPFMFDRDKPALLGPLIALFRRVPVFPVAPAPVRRSMLTYPDAAALLVREAEGDVIGARAAADPEPFTYALLVALMRERELRAPALVRLPGFAAAVVRRLPGIGARLFASSVLDPHANVAAGAALPRGLVHEIGPLLDRLRDGRPNPGASR